MWGGRRAFTGRPAAPAAAHRLGPGQGCSSGRGEQGEGDSSQRQGPGALRTLAAVGDKDGPSLPRARGCEREPDAEPPGDSMGTAHFPQVLRIAATVRGA